MTQLLEQAFSEASKLSADAQDTLARRILRELRDEQAWDDSFDRTTDDQWDRMAAAVRAEIASGNTDPLEDFLK